MLGGGRKALLNNAREQIIEQIDPDMVALMEGKAACPSSSKFASALIKNHKISLH